ncbi:MAG: ABC transporter ATP-binding protein [Verrucomicrobia bacterium]|nr:ABC transporter ATP-binding protein [Verrucomicrobiota bacterium]
MSAPDSLLRLANVTKRYPGAAAGDLPVLRGLSLEVARGETVAIVGPSGCGKSTLLNLIGTLDLPDSGELILDGQRLDTLDELALAATRNRQIGFIFQSHHLLPQCTVLENVLVPTLAKVGQASSLSSPSESPLDRAKQLLTRVGLTERMSYRPGQLSGGERQRVAVVRALINQPKLLLADEPTGALDRATADALAALLLDLNREQGTALIVVTHAPDLAKRMGRVLELRDGVLTAQ